MTSTMFGAHVKCRRSTYLKRNLIKGHLRKHGRHERLWVNLAVKQWQFFLCIIGLLHYFNSCALPLLYIEWFKSQNIKLDSHKNCHSWQALCEDSDNEEWVAEEHRIRSYLAEIGGNIPVPRLDNLPVPTALDRDLHMHDLVVNAFRRAEHPKDKNMEELDHGGCGNPKEKIGDLDDDEEY